jgi:hypothetical protein
MRNSVPDGDLLALWQTLMAGPVVSLELTRTMPYAPAEVLLYYDGPLLTWLPVARRHLLAFAVPAITDDSGEERHWPFVVVELSEATVAGLNSGTLTLRGVVLQAKELYLMPDYYAAHPELRRIDVALPDAWLPGDAPLYPAGIDK